MLCLSLNTLTCGAASASCVCVCPKGMLMGPVRACACRCRGCPEHRQPHLAKQWRQELVYRQLGQLGRRQLRPVVDVVPGQRLLSGHSPHSRSLA